jgi:predicted nucleotidyltransferase
MEKVQLIENETINKILDDIELKHNIKFVFAIESGSRAWGMASPDSDYDIRGVYINLDPIKRNSHVLFKKTKPIDGFTEDKLYDWNLWGFSDYLCYLKENNSSAIDWTISTMCYRGKENLERIQELFTSQMSTNVLCYHHYGLMKSQYKKYLDPQRNNSEYMTNKTITDKINNVKYQMEFLNNAKNMNDEWMTEVINNTSKSIQVVKSLLNNKRFGNKNNKKANEALNDNTKAEETNDKETIDKETIGKETNDKETIDKETIGKETNNKEAEEKVNMVKSIKKILYMVRCALNIEYIRQHTSIPPVDINDIIPLIELKFDKQLVIDLIEIKKELCEFDEYECPQWVLDWYDELNLYMIERGRQERKKNTRVNKAEGEIANDNSDVKATQVEADDYIKYYLEFTKQFEESLYFDLNSEEQEKIHEQAQKELENDNINMFDDVSS